MTDGTTPQLDVFETPDGWYFVGIDLGEGKYERHSPLLMSEGAAKQWLADNPEGESDGNNQKPVG